MRNFVPTSYDDASGVSHSMSLSVWNEYMSSVAMFYNGEDVCTFEITATGTYSSLASKTVAMVYDTSTVSISVNDVQLSPDEIVL